MAIIPANKPGPTIATNNRAQIIEFIDREDTITSKAIGRIKFLFGDQKDNQINHMV